MKKLIPFLFLILFLVGCKAPEPTVTPTTEPAPEVPTENVSEIIAMDCYLLGCLVKSYCAGGNGIWHGSNMAGFADR